MPGVGRGCCSPLLVEQSRSGVDPLAVLLLVEAAHSEAGEEDEAVAAVLPNELLQFSGGHDEAV